MHLEYVHNLFLCYVFGLCLQSQQVLNHFILYFTHMILFLCHSVYFQQILQVLIHFILYNICTFLTHRSIFFEKLNANLFFRILYLTMDKIFFLCHSIYFQQILQVFIHSIQFGENHWVPVGCRAFFLCSVNSQDYFL